MGLFNKLLNKEAAFKPINVDDKTIVAMADGEIIDVKTLSDQMFADEIMGKTIAFKYHDDKVTLCSPANGTLSVLYPTGHAFGVTTNNGVSLLIHCGIDTVNARGEGFRLLKKKQGDNINAGEPIVEVDIKKLSNDYDMSTMLIVTDANEKDLEFLNIQNVKRGETLIKINV